MDRAADLEDEDPFLVSRARTRAFILGDRPMARRLLEEAEDNVHSVSDLQSCAEAWLELFGDRERARRLLDRAESMEGSTRGLPGCADLETRYFQQHERARRLLVRSQRNLGGHCSSAIMIARLWVELFVGREQARGLLEEAEKRARGTYDWSQCRQSWLGLVGDREAASTQLAGADPNGLMVEARVTHGCKPNGGSPKNSGVLYRNSRSAANIPQRVRTTHKKVSSPFLNLRHNKSPRLPA